jgi:hypothetical protein
MAIGIKVHLMTSALIKRLLTLSKTIWMDESLFTEFWMKNYDEI